MNGKFYCLTGQSARTLLWSVLVLLALPAWGQEECLLLIHGSEMAEDRLTVEYTLTGLFDEEIQEVVETGMPATLLIQWRLWREREAWPDKRIGGDRVFFRILYDVLEDKYDIFNHRGRLVANTGDFTAVDSLLCHRRELTLPLPDDLKRKHLYFVELEITLEPLPSDQIRNLEGWLSGEQNESSEGTLLSGVSRYTENMLKKMTGLDRRTALAKTPPFQGTR